jgi:hypothetical protein
MLEGGRLHEKEDVKILILYTLSKLNRAIPTRALVDLFLNSEIVEYFTLKEAIDELIGTGHIAVDVEEGVTVLTRLGYEAAKELSPRLPVWARDRVIKGAMELLSQIDRRSGTRVRTFERDGQHIAECSLTDCDDLLFKLEIALPSPEFAFSTGENFKDNAADIYRFLLQKLSGPYKDSF